MSATSSRTSSNYGIDELRQDLDPFKPLEREEEKDAEFVLFHDRTGVRRPQRLQKEKVGAYATHRSEPAADKASRMSPCFAASAVSWCECKKRVPLVDAGERQISTEAYTHNRLRTNLLIDYLWGEGYFVEHLAEKYDPKGYYLRRWVLELGGAEGKAVFDPYNRLSRREFEEIESSEAAGRL
ncbi:hypothetical protein DL767_004651 [Monosporascus sp. MG133]|nr:hypothetical protein DL767_004651 [Monosporascus sp. MG133]